MQNHTLIIKPAIKIMGISCKTSNARAAQDIPMLWQRFYGEAIMDKIPNKSANVVYGLYCDYEGDFTKPYTLVIGCPVDAVDTTPEGLTTKTIPQSHYAVYRAIGQMPESIVSTWQTIWQDPQLKRSYTGDFEVYGEKYFSGSPQEVEIFIAVS